MSPLFLQQPAGLRQNASVTEDQLLSCELMGTLAFWNVLSGGQRFLFLIHRPVLLLRQPVSLSLKSWGSSIPTSRAACQALSPGRVGTHRKGHQGKPVTTCGEQERRARAIGDQRRDQEDALGCLGRGRRKEKRRKMEKSLGSSENGSWCGWAYGEGCPASVHITRTVRTAWV